MKYVQVMALVGMTLSTTAALEQSTPSVFVKNSEIFVTDGGSSAPRQLTTDGLPKMSPTVSRDGKYIAYLTEGRERARGTIGILSSDGSRLREIAFRPVPEKVGGMRGVERLEWVTDTTLAVSGSLNPSTCEFVVIDAESGKELNWYLVDGFSWAASPDGSHAAYIGYVPHFTSNEDRRPQFCFDDECSDRNAGYPPRDRHVEFDGRPSWSPDGTAAAISGTEYKSGKPLIVARRLGAKPLELAPDPTARNLRFSWEGNDLVVLSANRTWRLKSGSDTLVIEK